MAAPTPTIKSYDLVLSDGTTPIGLTCVKDKNGRPLLDRYYAPTLADQQFTELSEAAYPASTQVIEVIDDFAGGFGKQFFDRATKRYLQSHGVDASFRNILIQGPVSVVTTKSTPTYASTATIANGGFESTPFSTGWTIVSGAWSLETITVQEGSQSAQLDNVVGGGELKRQLTAADSSLFNTLQITISVYGRTETGGNTTLDIQLKDGSGTLITSSGATAITNGSWTQVSKVFTFTDGWPALWLHLVVATGGGAQEAYLDNVTVALSGSIATAADMGTVVKLIEFNTNHYAVSDTGVWKRSAANWVRVAGSPDAITDAATDGTTLYLCRGTTKNYWYMATGETFTRNTGTGASSQPIKMAWVAGSMYGTDDPQTVWKYNALASGGTSNTYTVGQTGYNITSLVNHLELVYITKENGLFYINSSGTVIEVLEQLRTLYNTNTGKNANSWNASLFVPAGPQSLMEYDAGDVFSVAPSRYAERLADFSGQVVALTGDSEWLYAILDNGANIEILKGRRETIAGVSDFRWHPFFEMAYATVSYAFVSSLTANRLWFGGGTGLPNYIPLPSKYADPLTDSNLTFKTAQTWEISWLNFKEDGVSKTFKTVEIQSTGLTTGYTVKVEYDIDDGNGYVELGGSGNGSFATSPTQTKSFASGVKGRRIKLRLTLYNTAATTGVGVFKIIITAVRNPTRLGYIVAKVRVKDDGVLRNGANDSDMSYVKVAAQLHAWASTEPLTLTILGVSSGKITGLSYSVKYDEGGPQEHFVNLGDIESGQGMESEFDLRFLVTA